MLDEWNTGEVDVKQVKEWEDIRLKVQRACMEMLQEIECDEDNDEIEKSKHEAQIEYMRQQAKKEDMVLCK